MAGQDANGDAKGGEGADQASAEQARPLLRVVRGDPTPEELAALVTAVSALAAGAAEAASRQRRPRPEWNAPHRLVRGPHRHGPGAWRAGSLPR